MKLQLYEPQPAYKIYAFDRGWRIINYVVVHLFKNTDVAARWWFDQARKVQGWAAYKPWYIKCWAIIAVCGGLWIAGAMQYVAAMIFVALCVAVQVTILSIWAAFSALFLGIVAASTFVYARFYRIFYRCPACHKDMPVPVYLCSKCRAEHTRLWPSIYGVVTHRCSNCETKLPAIGSRLKALTRICPHCRRPLNEGIGTGTNVHIPIVGGPFSGKTNFIVMATRDMKRLYESRGYKITFTDSQHQSEFEANLQRLATGRELLKTHDIVPQAYNLAFKAPHTLVPKITYIYDAAGEAFNSSENTNSQIFYKYIDGLIFTIDPCAIPSFHSLHRLDIDAMNDSLRPSPLDVMQAYERMKQMFEDSVGFQKNRRYNHPIAVVVTKTDVLNLESEIGEIAATRLMQSNGQIKSQNDAINMLVRDFLIKYEVDHLVRELELNFSNVRYFSCSALGRLPMRTDTRSFVPIRVIEPVAWLLYRTHALRTVDSMYPKSHP